MDTGRASGICADPRILTAWLKRQGLLPANVIRQERGDFPAPDYNVSSGGSVTRLKSQAKLDPNGLSLAFGYSLGASYAKVLMVGKVRMPSANAMEIQALDTTPGNTAFSGAKAYVARLTTTDFSLAYRTNGGAPTTLGTAETTICPAGTAQSLPTYTLGLYVDGTAHIMKAFLRTDDENFLTVEASGDTNIATFAYAGLWLNGSNKGWAFTPFEIRAE